jgi:DNA-binding GntR family transcriptional regulator
MKSLTLYEKVSHEISHLIESGTFRPGDRIPSVRKLSRQLKVSISTSNDHLYFTDTSDIGYFSDFRSL